MFELTFREIIHSLEEMKEAIAASKKAIKDSKTKHDTASQEVKRIEKEMEEFATNKDSKLTELQKTVDKLRKDLEKTSASIKPLQQSMREAKFDQEQCGGDLSASQEALQEIQTSLKGQKEEVDGLKLQQKRIKVRALYERIYKTSETYGANRTSTTLRKRIWMMSGPN